MTAVPSVQRWQRGGRRLERLARLVEGNTTPGAASTVLLWRGNQPTATNSQVCTYQSLIRVRDKSLGFGIPYDIQGEKNLKQKTCDT